MLVRARSVAVCGAAVGLLLAGCASGSTGGSESAGGPLPRAQHSGSAAPAARTTDPSPAPADSAEPTLPPGDPGADAPGVNDPNAAATEPEPEHTAAAHRHVPAAALLDADTVGAVTGSSWAAAAAAADACSAPRPRGAIAARDAALTSATGGQLVETVATYADADAARAAVHELHGRLAGCAGARPSDPRVGDASVQASVTAPDGSTTVVTAIAAEGVVAVLSGRGAVAGEASWPALTDLALGNTCAAAVDGCH